MITYYHAHFTGEPRATCNHCGRVWAYWEDASDLEHACPDTYTIERPAEETHCNQCGQPLDVGDTVYTDNAETITYTTCSRACAKKYSRLE